MKANFSGTIKRLGGQTVTVTRRAKGVYTNGRYVPATSSTFEIDNCSVQPLNDREVQNLAEGQRTTDSRKLYSPVRLQVQDDPDHVTFDGVEYEVQGIANWSQQGNFHRYLLVQVEK